MPEFLTFAFMQRALIAALLVGLAAPLVGVFLVQRRLSLIGDGMGHIALAGVAIGVLSGQEPVITALILAVAAAVAIELVRARGRLGGDTVLAVVFYGGIALGVVLLARAPGGGAMLNSYLFGAITTTSASDLAIFAALSALVVGVMLVLRSRLFAVAHDEEFSRAAGLPVLALNLTLAVLTAITVVVSMRVVGLLLISALMIVPTAAAQAMGRSFRAVMSLAIVIGMFSSVGGVVSSYYLNTPSGGTIVLFALAVFVVASATSWLRTRAARRAHVWTEAHEHEHGDGCGHEAIVHEDHIDYLHDGHLHSPHLGHYHEHGEDHAPGQGQRSA